MLNISLMIICAAAGIALGVLYCLLVIKKYPENKRIKGYAGAVIVFLLIALIVGAIISVRSFTVSKINDNAAKIEQIIISNNPANGFIKNGIDLKKTGSDSAQMGAAFHQIKSLLPSSAELGMPKFLYDIIADSALDGIQKRFTSTEKNAKMISTYADKNSVLTISSVINGVKNKVINIVNIVLLVLFAIAMILLLTYLIKTIKAARKG